jgi:DNA-binding MarR family transcriptional regulator
MVFRAECIPACEGRDVPLGDPPNRPSGCASDRSAGTPASRSPGGPSGPLDFHVNCFLSYHLGMSSSSAPHLEAWRAVVTSHASVTDRVQRALTAADLPPLSWFELLRAVKSSPDGRPRMSELADWLTLSRGGITKLVDRLQEAGYLERASCSADRRSLHAELTPAGEKMLEEMRLVYESEIQRHLATLTPEECGLITASLQKVTGSTCAKAHAELEAQGLDPALAPVA